MALVEQQVQQAITALLKYHEKKKNEPNEKGQAELIKDEEHFTLQIALKLIPKRRGYKPRRM